DDQCALCLCRGFDGSPVLILRRGDGHQGERQCRYQRQDRPAGSCKLHVDLPVRMTAPLLSGRLARTPDQSDWRATEHTWSRPPRLAIGTDAWTAVGSSAVTVQAPTCMPRDLY